MSDVVFTNMDVLDVAEGRLRTRLNVLVRNGVITAVSDGVAPSSGARVIDLKGRVLMPGLIDCHVHILAPGRGRSSAYPDKLPSYMHYHSTVVLRDFLSRGFTSVRDAGGADRGHKNAVDQGLVPGPRLFVSGRALSQTGGHGDKRPGGDMTAPCGCSAYLNSNTCRIADGVEGVRLAVREELRLGADQIKVIAGGGIVSETDPLDHLQYSTDELLTIADEARRAHTYAFAHAYTPEAIERCVEVGFRTIEHGNFLDDTRARMMADAGTYLVPTLATYQVLADQGRSIGLSDAQMEKVHLVLSSGSRSLEIAQRYGVKMGLGTDVVTNSTDAQSREVLIRGEVLSAAEVIRSATLIGAEIVRRPGRLGVIAEGAYADLLAIDGNPLEDLSLLANDGQHISMIMKGGTLYKEALHAAYL